MAQTRKRISKATWTKCQVMFEAGDTLGQIVKATKVSKSGLSERATRYGWVKAKNRELMIRDAELRGEIANLSEHERTRHEVEVARLVEDTKLIHEIARKNLRTLNQKLDIKERQLAAISQEDYTLSPDDLIHFDPDIDLKAAKTIDISSLTLGVNKRHSETNINNNNSATAGVQIVIAEDEQRL